MTRNIRFYKKNTEQHLATDPKSSAWVSASAGTGKTKVLTDRILRLMLAGVAPQKILCLTFTRSAATEMLHRLNERLLFWNTANPNTLAGDLAELEQTPVTTSTMKQARCLLPLVLDAPNSMRIQTIHSFCESVLRRFPLEANISPSFTILDERATTTILETLLTDLAHRLDKVPTSRLANAFHRLAMTTNETSFKEILFKLASNRGQLSGIFSEPYHVADHSYLMEVLSVEDNESPDSIIMAASDKDVFDGPSLIDAARKMAGGTKTDKSRSSRITTWIAKSHDERTQSFEEYLGAFLNKRNKPLTRMISNSLKISTPELLPILKNEQSRVHSAVTTWKNATLFEANHALLQVCCELLKLYEREKRSLNALDFDDLILTSKNLLQNRDIAPWILYQLDGGIDHILIDEAQDTNPDQWAIIRALADDFSSGNSAQGLSRTLFAVGDPKQSIYSFQNAKPEVFWEMGQYYRSRFLGARLNWNDVSLTTCYRSTSAILEAVDLVLSQRKGGKGVIAAEIKEKLSTARTGAAGLVEVWPVIDPGQNITPLKQIADRTIKPSPSTTLARLIARKVETLCSKNYHSDTTTNIQPKDILILVRQRSSFVVELIKELGAQNIPVSGIDRLNLTDHIAVMDLISLGQFLLLPSDDLSLAEVLKSPLCQLDDTDLFLIADKRPGSLWQALLDHPDKTEAQQEAETLLNHLLEMAPRLGPYDFYAELLSLKGGRKKFRNWLGDEVIEPLKEFLECALTYEEANEPSLQGFIDWIQLNSPAISFNTQNSNDNSVRISTVHGAKGLEAPIVFLTDTIQIPRQIPRLLWMHDQEQFVWAPKRDVDNKFVNSLLEEAIEARNDEYRRLLYVGMTRARDSLYVCGWNSRSDVNKDSWYDLVYSSIKPRATTQLDRFLTNQNLIRTSEVLRLYHPQTVNYTGGQTNKTSPSPKSHSYSVLPIPSLRILKQTPESSVPIESPYRSAVYHIDKVMGDQNERALIPRVLQCFPKYPLKSGCEKARSFLAQAALGLTAESQEKLFCAAVGILSRPELATIFAHRSRIGVALSGQFCRSGTTYDIYGTIDRLLIGKSTVKFVNFSEHQDDSIDISETPPRILKGMAAYWLLLRKLYPTATVEGGLLHLEKPRLVNLSGTLLDKWLP